MDPFLPSSSSVGSSSPPSTEALMEQVELQLAQAHAEEFLEMVKGKCFAKCITKPGTSLAGVKVAASPGVWIVISKLQESLAEHSSVLHANVQPVILNPSRELQVVHVIDRFPKLLTARNHAWETAIYTLFQRRISPTLPVSTLI